MKLGSVSTNDPRRIGPSNSPLLGKRRQYPSTHKKQKSPHGGRRGQSRSKATLAARPTMRECSRLRTDGIRDAVHHRLRTMTARNDQRQSTAANTGRRR